MEAHIDSHGIRTPTAACAIKQRPLRPRPGGIIIMTDT
jgi:hypothetical protein